MDGKELKEENITKTEGKKKGKIVIIVLTIVILLLVGCICFLLFKMNENKTHKKENTKEIEKGEINKIEKEKKGYVFAYVDYDYNIYIMDDSHVITKIVDSEKVNPMMSRRLIVDNNKLYYLSKDKKIHSVDLSTSKFNDTDYGVSIEDDDITYRGAHTFFVKDDVMAYIDTLTQEIVKVNLNTKEEEKYSYSEITSKSPVGSYYDFYHDYALFDVNDNAFNPLELLILSKTGIKNSLSYRISHGSTYMTWTNETMIVGISDKKDCIYHLKDEKLGSCVDSKLAYKKNYYQPLLFNNSIINFDNNRIVQLKDGDKSLTELFSLPDELKNKDMYKLFPSKDGIVLQVGTTKTCNERCSYDYRYYYVTLDGQYQEIEKFNQGDLRKDILSFVAIQ